MTERGHRRLAWALAIVAMTLAAIGAAFTVRSRHVPLPPQSFGPRGFATVLAIELAVLGLLLATKRPENAIGWLALGAAIGAGLQELADGYAIWAVAGQGSTEVLARLAAIGEDWIWLASFGLGVLVLPLFPDGRPLSRRWGVWIGICAGGTAVAILGYAISSHPLVFTDVVNPVGVHGAYEVANASASFFFLLLVTGLASLVIRFRRSTGDDHEQMKWLAASTSLVVAMFAAYLIVYGVAGTEGLLGNVLETAIVLAVFTIPVSIGIAILKYHLYDIDVVISKTLVAGALAAFIAVVYVAIVVGVGALVGSHRSPVLSAVAAAVVAIAFQPVRRRADRVANRLVFGRRATPYEVLSEFSDRLSQAYSLEDVTMRLVRLVADGTGADRASVWLLDGELFREEASTDGTQSRRLRAASDGDVPALPDDEHAVPVVHQGDVLGAISVRMPASEAFTDAHRRLLTDVAGQAGLVLRNVRLVADLRDSRRRIVAAQDARARKLERDIHDGAQQQLVALAVKQRLLTGLIGTDDERARAIADGLVAETNDALENLRDLARGIYPPLLADKGLAAALKAQARKAPLPVTVEADGVGRFPQQIEGTVYFCTLEALNNVAKYAEASRATVRLANGADVLSFEIEDDGRGFDPDAAGYGTGLQGIADRLAALGGSLAVHSSPGSGTTVAGSLPVMEATP